MQYSSAVLTFCSAALYCLRGVSTLQWAVETRNPLFYTREQPPRPGECPAHFFYVQNAPHHEHSAYIRRLKLAPRPRGPRSFLLSRHSVNDSPKWPFRTLLLCFSFRACRSFDRFYFRYNSAVSCVWGCLWVFSWGFTGNISFWGVILAK